MLHRNFGVIYLLTTPIVAVAETTTPSKLVTPSVADAQDDHEQTFSLFLDYIATGGTAPTIDVDIEHSIDNNVFVKHSNSTQRTAAGTYRETIVFDHTKPLYRYVRLKIKLGGTAAPTITAMEAKLTSSGLFRIS